MDDDPLLSQAAFDELIAEAKRALKRNDEFKVDTRRRNDSSGKNWRDRFSMNSWPAESRPSAISKMPNPTNGSQP